MGRFAQWFCGLAAVGTLGYVAFVASVVDLPVLARLWRMGQVLVLLAIPVVLGAAWLGLWLYRGRPAASHRGGGRGHGGRTRGEWFGLVPSRPWRHRGPGSGAFSRLHGPAVSGLGSAGFSSFSDRCAVSVSRLTVPGRPPPVRVHDLFRGQRRGQGAACARTVTRRSGQRETNGLQPLAGCWEEGAKGMTLAPDHAARDALQYRAMRDVVDRIRESLPGKLEITK